MFRCRNTNFTQKSAVEAAEALANAGFDVSAAEVDISSRASVQALVEKAQGLGEITGLVHAAGVSPSQAPMETILKVDLYGTALVLELFGAAIARGGSGVVISSQSGHRLPALTPEQHRDLATTPTEDLLKLGMLQPGQVSDTLHAYHLRSAQAPSSRRWPATSSVARAARATAA